MLHNKLIEFVEKTVYYNKNRANLSPISFDTFYLSFSLVLNNLFILLFSVCQYINSSLSLSLSLSFFFYLSSFLLSLSVYLNSLPPFIFLSKTAIRVAPGPCEVTVWNVWSRRRWGAEAAALRSPHHADWLKIMHCKKWPFTFCYFFCSRALLIIYFEFYRNQ